MEYDQGSSLFPLELKCTLIQTPQEYILAHELLFVQPVLILKQPLVQLH